MKKENLKAFTFKVSKDANHMIEEFMLLANKKGSKFIGKKSLFIEFDEA
jgi:exoribonuclease R